MKQGRIHLGIVLVLGGAIAAAACGGGDGGSSGNVTVTPDAGITTTSDLCPGGKPVDYPPGPYGISVLGVVPPDLAFGDVKLKDYFDPCAPQPKLLVVRTSAAWCGTCLWSASHTKRIFDDPALGGRVTLLDLLVADEDNMPATAPALARWLGRIDMPGKAAIDTKFTFAPVLLARSPLPEYVFVDTRTMTIRGAVGGTAPEAVQNKIRVELAIMDKAPRPDLATPVLLDGYFTEDQADMLRDMKLVPTPPPDPTNEYADVAGAVALGKKLFTDNSLSPNAVSCAKCHDEGFLFTDQAGQSTGVAKVDRNAPSVVVAGFARWQFWDGRADTLWAQALGPPENPKEIGSTRLYIAHQIAKSYAADYAAVFAKYPLPANLDTLPSDGKPGDAAYDALPQADKDAVTRIYVNVGKAIAAFQRSIRVQPNKLDAYAGGDLGALAPNVKKGLQSFFVAGCPQCHWGPNMTDDAFHVLRFPTGRQDGAPDKGRIDVITKLASAEFAATSQWSDNTSAAKPLTLMSDPSMLGAFKTPALRGVASTAPYGHGGTLLTLSDVAKHYGTRAKDVGDDKATGTVEAWVPEFDANAQAEIATFLEVLRADLQP